VAVTFFEFADFRFRACPLQYRIHKWDKALALQWLPGMTELDAKLN
jgi:hypothetical protein